MLCDQHWCQIPLAFCAQSSLKSAVTVWKKGVKKCHSQPTEAINGIYSTLTLNFCILNVFIKYFLVSFRTGCTFSSKQQSESVLNIWTLKRALYFATEIPFP